MSSTEKLGGPLALFTPSQCCELLSDAQLRPAPLSCDVVHIPPLVATSVTLWNALLDVAVMAAGAADSAGVRWACAALCNLRPAFTSPLPASNRQSLHDALASLNAHVDGDGVREWMISEVAMAYGVVRCDDYIHGGETHHLSELRDALVMLPPDDPRVEELCSRISSYFEEEDVVEDAVAPSSSRVEDSATRTLFVTAQVRDALVALGRTAAAGGVGHSLSVSMPAVAALLYHITNVVNTREGAELFCTDEVRDVLLPLLQHTSSSSFDIVVAIVLALENIVRNCVTMCDPATIDVFGTRDTWDALTALLVQWHACREVPPYALTALLYIVGVLSNVGVCRELLCTTEGIWDAIAGVLLSNHTESVETVRVLNILEALVGGADATRAKLCCLASGQLCSAVAACCRQVEQFRESGEDCSVLEALCRTICNLTSVPKALVGAQPSLHPVPTTLDTIVATERVTLLAAGLTTIIFPSSTSTATSSLTVWVCRAVCNLLLCSAQLESVTGSPTTTTTTTTSSDAAAVWADRVDVTRSLVQLLTDMTESTREFLSDVVGGAEKMKRGGLAVEWIARACCCLFTAIGRDRWLSPPSLLETSYIDGSSIADVVALVHVSGLRILAQVTEVLASFAVRSVAAPCPGALEWVCRATSVLVASFGKLTQHQTAASAIRSGQSAADAKYFLQSLVSPRADGPPLGSMLCSSSHHIVDDATAKVFCRTLWELINVCITAGRLDWACTFVTPDVCASLRAALRVGATSSTELDGGAGSDTLVAAWVGRVLWTLASTINRKCMAHELPSSCMSEVVFLATFATDDMRLTLRELLSATLTKNPLTRSEDSLGSALSVPLAQPDDYDWKRRCSLQVVWNILFPVSLDSNANEGDPHQSHNIPLAAMLARIAQPLSLFAAVAAQEAPVLVTRAVAEMCQESEWTDVGGDGVSTAPVAIGVAQSVVGASPVWDMIMARMRDPPPVPPNPHDATSLLQSPSTASGRLSFLANASIVRVELVSRSAPDIMWHWYHHIREQRCLNNNSVLRREAQREQTPDDVAALSKLARESEAAGSAPGDPHVVLAWHGTQVSHVRALCRDGPRNFRNTDTGFFGAGVYFSLEAAYAARYSDPEGDDHLCAIVLFAVSVTQVHPVTVGKDYNPNGSGFCQFSTRGSERHHGQSIALAAGCDAHFIPVRYYGRTHPCHPGSPPTDVDVDFQATSAESATYHELVVQSHNQCMPVAVVYFHKATSDVLTKPGAALDPQ